MKKKKKELSTTQIIMLGFLITILIGSVILMLPVCSADGTVTPYLTSLFTATTSVCVTGLVAVDTYAHWSVFGQIVILILVQCGGLGVVTLSTLILTMLGQKISLKQRLLLEDALNLDTLSGLILFIRKVVKGTLLIEGVGALCYMLVFVPEFGLRGIWISIFNAVSAFCNAGMDIIGPNSLMQYVSNPLINIVTMSLIILGGLGFIVWWDVLRVVKAYRQKKLHKHQIWQKLRFHSKVVLCASLGLTLAGFFIVLLLEWSNPQTLGSLSLPAKLWAAMFQSVTFRTAGFLTVSQKGLHDTTALCGLLLMLIGGSPVGTAGGIKTTTAAVLFFAAWSTIKGRSDTCAFHRKIDPATVRKALSITMISIMAVFIALMLVLTFCEGDFIDLAYEVFSAVGTVGLTRDVTQSLNVFGKCVIIVCMYLGRTGPISLVIAFNNLKGKSKGLIEYPEETITVG